ncbi:MAG: hypothetical protein SFV32_13175 [Opitutaceae bacterium]|nr:hypothetical protein [Opitutaceae bacterium]
MNRTSRIALLFAFANWLGAMLIGGTVQGRVEAKAPEEASDGSAAGAYGSRRFKFLEKTDYAAIREFVVFIEHIPTAPDRPKAKASIAQKDGAFVPRMLPVVMGTEVEFTNMDDIFHNVFSMSDACNFDLGLYKRGDGKRVVRFDLPGRVDVFCSIHAQMACVILVVPNHWVAKTDSGGRYTIPDVPAGRYRLKAWHERLPSKVQEIEVTESGLTVSNFVLGPGR